MKIGKYLIELVDTKMLICPTPKIGQLGRIGQYLGRFVLRFGGRALFIGKK